jgi:hypothetical protein
VSGRRLFSDSLPRLRGRVRVGGTRFQRSHNLLQHCLSLPEDLIIPETQYTKTLGLQSAISILVIRYALLVLASIKLDYKFRFKAREIRDETCDRHLPTKPVAVYLSAPQMLP